jgi:dihydroorotase
VETIATGTKAAVLGGLTAVFDMPNTIPSITNAEQLAWKREHVSTHAYCDMGLYVGARARTWRSWRRWRRENVCAVKVFAGSSTGTC